MKRSANYQMFKSWLIILLPIFVFILLTRFIIFNPSIEFIDDFLDPRGKGLEEYFAVVFFLCLIWNIVVIIMNKKYFLSVAIPVLFWILMFFTFFFTWGHPTKAKPSATKSIHAQTVKYISADTMKCALGEITAMDGNLTCSELNAANVVVAAVKTLTDKNPYSIKNNAVRISTSNTKDEDVGFVNLSASDSNVIVKSCHKKSCSDKNNRLSKTIEIK